MIVAPIGESFRLQDLGDARGAAQRFLSTTVAPEGSDKQARLLMASERYPFAAILCAIMFRGTSQLASSWPPRGGSSLPVSVQTLQRHAAAPLQPGCAH